MNKKTSLIVLLAGVVLLALQGCNKSECKEVECANGVCVEGNCLCNSGWTGVNCDQVDKCYQRTCTNGYCADGTCVCDPLYEGNTCSTPINMKFSGDSWFVRDSSTSSNFVHIYQIEFNPDPSVLSKFYITNLYNDNRTIAAYVGSDNLTFSFERQFIYQFFPTFVYSAESVSASLNASHFSGSITYDIFDNTNNGAFVERRIATFIKY